MQFAPRVGFPYQVAPKTVLRGGYGIFWLPNDVAGDTSPNSEPINSYSTNYLATIYQGIPAGSISNPYPQGIIAPTGRNVNYAQTLLGSGPLESQLANPYGYAQQWNFDLQHQFGDGFLLDVAYGGSKGTHLPIGSPQIDQLPDQYLTLGNQLTQNVANPFYPYINTPGSPLSQPTVQLGQLLRPYPQYNGITYAGEGIGNSTYESLQVSATKRFSGGNSISLAYTHAKLISDTESLTGWLEAAGNAGIQDFNNIRAEKSLASFDTPDRLVVSYVMDIPVGKGRKYMANANGFVNAAIGGWRVQGVTTIQSGFPLHFTTNTNTTNSFGGNQRPNIVPGCDGSISGSATSRPGEWFNTACFSQPAVFTFGDASRVDSNFTLGRIANWDFSAFKNFTISPEDRLKLQFRAEFFNIFNRVQFNAPGQALGAVNFGVVAGQQNTPRLIQLALRLNF
jgi:hypothetical protein